MANTVSAYFQLSGGKDGFLRGGIEKLKKRIASLNLSTRTVQRLVKSYTSKSPTKKLQIISTSPESETNPADTL